MVTGVTWLRDNGERVAVVTLKIPSALNEFVDLARL